MSPVDTVVSQFREIARTHRLGTLVEPPSEQHFGRNINITLTTDSGRYFVKKLRFADAHLKVSASAAYDRFAGDSGAGLPRSPRCLVADRDSGLIVQPHLDDAESGTTLMVDHRFSPDIAAAVGSAIARLHGSGRNGVPDSPAAGPAPEVRLLDGIPLRTARHMTGAELQAYGLFQRDRELCESLRGLLEASASAARAPVHGDLRVDQILVNTDGTWVIDWEEFGLGDPARDTGSFLGEWLYRTVLDIPTSRGGGDPLAHDADDPAEIVRRGNEKARRLAPVADAFWAAYRRTRPVDRDFVHRTGAFAGWHLLDRLVAGAAVASSLSPIHRAAAGVGRSALLNPAGVFHTLGIDSDPDLTDFDTDREAA